MMGVGKSTIGKSLSKKLNMNFFDTDSMIENEEKMTIKNIFEKKGEEHFRKIEKKTIDYNINDKYYFDYWCTSQFHEGIPRL